MSLAVGMIPPARTFGPLALADLVRYAGASNDFQPLHFDEAFARSAGFRGPIVHGMLSAGLLGTYLGDWLGVESVRRFRVRFHQPVAMGATVTATGSVLSIDGGRAEIELTLTAAGVRVVSATATVELGRVRVVG